MIPMCFLWARRSYGTSLPSLMSMAKSPFYPPPTAKTPLQPPTPLLIIRKERNSSSLGISKLERIGTTL